MAAILENVGSAITRLPVDRFLRDLSGRIPSCPRHVSRRVVPMVTAVCHCLATTH